MRFRIFKDKVHDELLFTITTQINASYENFCFFFFPEEVHEWRYGLSEYSFGGYVRLRPDFRKNFDDKTSLKRVFEECQNMHSTLH